MPDSSRRAPAALVDALCAVVGRRSVVRAARFALRRARLDLPNVPQRNGEYALQRWLLADVPEDGMNLLVFDVGANVGDWSLELLRQAERVGLRHRLRLHTFEPCADTYQRLLRRLPPGVVANRLALSDSSGERVLHVTAPGSGVNSLHPRIEPGRPATAVELVPVGTLDEYVIANDIERVDLLKIDAEGDDFAVLLGAQKLLGERRIRIVQFEYNHRWISARRYLKDVFDLAEPFGYRLGKLSPRGVEWYPGWDPELETFVEGNYLLVAPGLTPPIPRIAWWKPTVENGSAGRGDEA